MKVFLAKNLKEAISVAEEEKTKGAFVVAVEAEWGDEALESPYADIALNHHGSRASNPCPSEIGIVAPQVVELCKKHKNKTYIVSHIDADTIFGIMWCEGLFDAEKGYAPDLVQIAKMVAFTDKNGRHIAMSELEALNDTDAFKKWLSLGLLFSRNAISFKGDISEHVAKIIYAASQIIFSKNIKESQIYKEALEWEAGKAKSAKEAITYKDDILLGFASKKFMCDNYALFADEDGIVRKIIIQYDLHNKSILLAAYDAKTAQDFFGKKGVVGPLQDFFGNEAGGHIAIGGSPRNKPMKWQDYKKFLKFIKSKIWEK